MEREAAPIRKIHVSDQGRFGTARIDATEQGLEALGYVIPNRVIGAALWDGLARLPGVRVDRTGTSRSHQLASHDTETRRVRNGCRAADTTSQPRRRGRRRALGDPRPGGYRGGPHRIRADRDHGDAHDAAIPRFRGLRTLYQRWSDCDPAIAGRALRHGLDTAPGRGRAPARVAATPNSCTSSRPPSDSGWAGSCASANARPTSSCCRAPSGTPRRDSPSSATRRRVSTRSRARVSTSACATR